MSQATHIMPVQRVTHSPLHHFFGYYDKCPWSRDGRYLLAMQNSFLDRNPTRDDSLTVGVIDLHDAQHPFITVGKTHAWNWQQGCMLRWMPPQEQRILIYNDLENNRYVSRIHDLDSHETRTFAHALYDIASDGRTAATLTFERITDTRPGYGYFGVPDPRADTLQPDDDGLYRVDMNTADRELIFSIAQAANFGNIKPDAGHKAWFNHIKFNPTGSRLLFLHRWAESAVPGHRGFQTRLFTINPDGTEPCCLIEDCGISHFDWLDDTHIAIWLFALNADESQSGEFTVAHDRSGERSILGNSLPRYDGHCNFSADRQWMLTDSYPRGPKREQQLMIYNPTTDQRIDIGAFAAMPVTNESWRCDLHPRWNRDGSQICIDSTHEGTRQMYVVNLDGLPA